MHLMLVAVGMVEGVAAGEGEGVRKGRGCERAGVCCVDAGARTGRLAPRPTGGESEALWGRADETGRIRTRNCAWYSGCTGTPRNTVLSRQRRVYQRNCKDVSLSCRSRRGAGRMVGCWTHLSLAETAALAGLTSAASLERDGIGGGVIGGDTDHLQSGRLGRHGLRARLAGKQQVALEVGAADIVLDGDQALYRQARADEPIGPLDGPCGSRGADVVSRIRQPGSSSWPWAPTMMRASAWAPPAGGS